MATQKEVEALNQLYVDLASEWPWPTKQERERAFTEDFAKRWMDSTMAKKPKPAPKPMGGKKGC